MKQTEYRYEIVSVTPIWLSLLELTTVLNCFDYNTQYTGTAFTTLTGHTTVLQCQVSCLMTPGCLTFEYFPIFSFCYLRSSTSTKATFVGKVSNVISAFVFWSNEEDFSNAFERLNLFTDKINVQGRIKTFTSFNAIKYPSN
jgi:hypothetical protein